MITVFKESGNEVVKTDFESAKDIELEGGSWIHISDPDVDSINEVAKLTSISSELLLCALDDEESARIDTDDGDTLIVLDTPLVEDEENAIYTTVPFIIAYNRSFYVTICKYNVELITELFKRVKTVEPHKHVRLTLYLVYRLATLFINYLKKINAHTEVLENKLRTSTKNKELLELMDINKTFIYFSTALNADKGVLSRLLRSQTYKKFESDFDLMEDTEVEMDQAIEMCSIYRNILSGMMDAFASIINNNMNIIMKTLAVVTIVISLPTLVASIYGMNFTNIPLDDNPNGFWIVLGICVVFAIIGTIILLLISNGNKRNK